MSELAEHYVTETRMEISRFVPYPPEEVFAVLTDPEGHVDIDSTGMLQSATGSPVSAVGDTFVIHMDRESLGDYDLGRYDVTVEFLTVDAPREIAWTIVGQLRPQIGHVYGYRLEPATDEGDDEARPGTMVTSYYDWTDIHEQWREADIFQVISASAVKATLGILERVLRRRSKAVSGY